MRVVMPASRNAGWRGLVSGNSTTTWAVGVTPSMWWSRSAGSHMTMGSPSTAEVGSDAVQKATCEATAWNTDTAPTVLTF